MDNILWANLLDSPWFFGLVVVSGAVGAVGTLMFFSIFWVLKSIVVCFSDKGLESKSEEVQDESFLSFLFTGVLMGMVERFFFTFSFWALRGNGILQAAIAWIAIKGQVHFQIFTKNKKGVPHAYLGLLGSLVSMAFAIFGGYLWVNGYTLSSSLICYREFFSCLNK